MVEVSRLDALETVIGSTKFCSSEDSAICHAREPAARYDDRVVNYFLGDAVVAVLACLLGMLVGTLKLRGNEEIPVY